jgi:hypothetical protein
MRRRDQDETEADFLRWLIEENGYAAPVILPGGRYACVNPRPFNTQIITAKIGARTGYDTAW